MSSDKKNNEILDPKETIANDIGIFQRNDTENINHKGSKNKTVNELETENKTQSLLLLQKAEILRLTQCMNEYKCKLRQSNEEYLDRKSYEIQIAQLFESNNKNRLQIVKLNNSIKSLVSSNEKYRKQLTIANQKVFQLQQIKRQLHEKYQILKFQYDITSKDFQNYKKQNEQNARRMHKQLIFQKSYAENLKVNSQELMKRVNSIPAYEYQIFELEKQISYFKTENEKLNEQILQFRYKIQNLERNYVELYQKNDKTEKNYDDLKRANSELQNKLNHFINQAIKDEQTLKLQNQPKNSTKEVKKITQLQQQIKNLNLRNQRIVINSKALTDLSNKLKEQKKCLETQISSLKRILSDYEQKINELLNKNSLLNHELNREQGQLRRQLTEKQQKCLNLSKQKEKLTEQVKGYNKMITNKIKQSQYLKRKLIQVQSDLRQQFESNFQEQKKSHYQQIAEIGKKMSVDYPQNTQQNKNSKQYLFIKQVVEKNQIKLQSQNAQKQDDTALAQSKTLKLLLQKNKAQVHKVTQQRNQVVNLLQNKTSENQKLKQKFFDLEQEYRDQLTKTVQKIKLSYEQKIDKLEAQLKAQQGDLKEKSTPQEMKQLAIQRNKLQKEVIQLKKQLKQSDMKFIETWKQIQNLHDILATNQLKYKTKIEVYFRNNLILQQNLNKINKNLAKKQIQFEESIKLLKELEQTNSENIKIFSNLQTQFISIQLLTNELKQERDLLLKKNNSLIKGIQHLNNQIKIIHEGAQKMSMFFTKDSSVHETLQKHYYTVQQIFNSIQKLNEEQEKDHKLQTYSNL